MTIPAPEQRNIRLIIAYAGAAYAGWQKQSHAPTIQGLVTSALEKITGAPVSLIGSGRTDAGTHARGLGANFFTGSRLTPEQFQRALNAILPRDIRILAAAEAAVDFHARRSAHSKIYRYQIYNGPVLPPHLLPEYFHFPYRLDFALMRQAAAQFVGEHDFASYAKSGSGVVNTVRHIFRCSLRRRDARVHLTVTGNGFLHHMVRNMAGTLLEVGRGQISLERFAALFAERDRTRAGFTAPAHGLILLKVNY